MEMMGKHSAKSLHSPLCSQMTYKIQQKRFGNGSYLHRRQMTRHGKAAFCSHQRATDKFSHGTSTHFYLQTRKIEQLATSMNGKYRRLEGGERCITFTASGKVALLHHIGKCWLRVQPRAGKHGSCNLFSLHGLEHKGSCQVIILTSFTSKIGPTVRLNISEQTKSHTTNKPTFI